MKDIIEKIKDMAKKEINEASNIKVLEELRVKYLGKKGEITQKLKELSAVSAELKPILGKLLNDVKRDIEELLGEKIYLKLWVRVKENWRNREGALHDFGYDMEDFS